MVLTALNDGNVDLALLGQGTQTVVEDPSPTNVRNQLEGIVISTLSKDCRSNVVTIRTLRHRSAIAIGRMWANTQLSE